MPAGLPDGNREKKIQGLGILMNAFLKLKYVIEQRGELAIQLRIFMCLLSEMSSGNTDTLYRRISQRGGAD